MRSDTDRALEDAYELGRKNAQIIELARRHCVNMEFQESGGRGLAEEASGLPINMRRVHCAFGKPANSMAMNLEWIAVDFYEENCEGCPHRRPTGQLPNLASVVEEQREAGRRAEADAAASLAGEQSAWEAREHRRQAIRSTATAAMSTALGDLSAIDQDPGASPDENRFDAARRRLEALADRGSELFTDDVVDHIFELVKGHGHLVLLGVLRRLALNQPARKGPVAALAVDVLAERASLPAAACLVDLRDQVAASNLSESVIQALVFLAGRPERDDFGHRKTRSANNDPAGLRVAADLRQDLVEATLRDLLTVTPSHRIDLELPLGVRGVGEDATADDFDRCAAAGAIRALVPTHPRLAASLIGALVQNLQSDEDDRFDLHPIGDVQRTLAILFVLEIGDVLAALETAAASAGEEHRERLFGVFERARWLVSERDRWREPHDPDLTGDEREVALRRIIGVGFARISGDWGDEVAWHAADLLKDLARDNAASMVSDIPAILGAFLASVEKLSDTPGASDLTIASSQPPEIAALEVLTLRHRRASAAGRLVEALEGIATADAVALIDAVVVALAEVKDSPSEVEVAWRLIPLLGDVGRSHGSKPGVLRRVLPILHTYLVHSDQSLRARAVEAWTEVGSKHRLPSSLADLLPALTSDTYVVVIKAILKAVRRLTWDEANRMRLLVYAVAVADGAPSTELLQEALFTVLALTRGDDAQRTAIESYVLDKAGSLSGYELRDVLEGRWLPTSLRSPAMATLRLAQARDPRVNDRWNARDDDELTALLACGPGLRVLSRDALREAALDLNPEYPAQGADFVEVAWRSGRPRDALEILRAMRARLPDQPVYADRIAFVDCLIAAAAMDVRSEDQSLDETLSNAARAAAVLTGSAEEVSDFRARLGRQLSARVRAAALLLGKRVPDGLPPAVADDMFDATAFNSSLGTTDPTVALRARAEALHTVATALDGNGQRLTDTGAYVRAFANLCVIAGHLLLASAATLDADRDQQESHRNAALARRDALVEQLRSIFAEDDPLAAPLISSLDQFDAERDEAEAVVAEWATLVVPLQLIDGPTRRTRSRTVHDEFPEEARALDETPVVVTVASLDGLVVTGTQVLRPETIYTLGLEVRGDHWPDWAERLDAEIISHMTQAEAQTPTFTWGRPKSSEGTFVLSGEGTILLRFGLSAGRPAPPFLVSLRFRGRRDGDRFEKACDVAGHRELRLRPFDSSRDALTQYRMVDERLLQIYDGLHEAGYNEDHIQAFCRLLTATCRAGMEMTWERRYRRGQKVSERKFHDDLFERLRAEPELEGRVERGSPLALGFLDVRHDGITAELKVERKQPVTRENVTKYIGQPTQYAAADGARLSILCVLDMSPKEQPIATAENYLWQLQPEHHGLTNPEAPSLVTVIVVNANLPVPSSWSRRRIAVRNGDDPNEGSNGTNGD